MFVKSIIAATTLIATPVLADTQPAAAGRDSLPDTATVLTRPKPVAASAATEKIICRRTLRAGTLADFERTCMTPTEWAKQSEQMKEVWHEIQGKKTTGGLPCGTSKDC